MTRFNPAVRFLMCAPEHFAVTYAINPWMEPDGWARNVRTLAVQSRRDWRCLHDTLISLGAAIDLVPPIAGLPDLVFTANAAVVFDRVALVSRFRHPERQQEEAHFEAAFHTLRGRGVIDTVTKLPDGLILEGAGDCVFDETRRLFWMGYGPRSDHAAHDVVKDTFGLDVVALELADARFYHIDTAFCPLPHGEVIYLPDAFTRAGRTAIHDRLAPHQRIEISMADAAQFAANAVYIGNSLVMAGCSDDLRDKLTERGYRVVTTPLNSFMLSGGAAFCLTLRLDRTETAMHAGFSFVKAALG